MSEPVRDYPPVTGPEGQEPEREFPTEEDERERRPRNPLPAEPDRRPDGGTPEVPPPLEI